jgi:hypothetical protein
MMGGHTEHTHSSGCSHGSEMEGIVSGVEQRGPPKPDESPESVEKTNVRFAAMDIEVEEDVPRSYPRTVESPVDKPKKERRKVAFMQHDKPELLEF